MLKNKLRFLFRIIFILVLLLTSFGAVQAESKTTADLKIISDPPGATVYVDGNLTKLHTPCTIKDLSIGDHRIELRKSKYRNEKKVVTVKPGQNSEEFSMAETSLYYMWLSLPALLLGALMTLFLTCVAVFNGIIIGTFTGVCRVIHI